MRKAIAAALGLQSEADAIDQMLAPGAGSKKLRVKSVDVAVGKALEKLGYEVGSNAPFDVIAVVASSVQPALRDQLKELTTGLAPDGRVVVASNAVFMRKASSRAAFCALLMHVGLSDLRQESFGGVLVTSGRSG